MKDSPASCNGMIDEGMRENQHHPVSRQINHINYFRTHYVKPKNRPRLICDFIFCEEGLDGAVELVSQVYGNKIAVFNVITVNSNHSRFRRYNCFESRKGFP